jgi:hypothetical protein
MCQCHRAEATQGILAWCSVPDFFNGHQLIGVTWLQVAAAHAAAAAAEEQQRLQEAERKETRARLQVRWQLNLLRSLVARHISMWLTIHR